MKEKPVTVGLFLLLLLAWITLRCYNYFYLPNATISTDVEEIIHEGQTGEEVAEALSQKGLISSKELFLFLTRFYGIDKGLNYGLYLIPAHASTLEVLNLFKGKSTSSLHLKIPEGYSLDDIASLVQRRALCSKEVFLQEATNCDDWLKKWSIEAPHVEGFLFPDTYKVSRGIKAQSLVGIMLKKFEEIYRKQLQKDLSNSPFSLYEILIMASIIEKETGKDEERPLVASVIINRLKKGMPLRCDPTVRYAMNNFKGSLKRSHLTVDSPYNTYQNKGLPPTPICSPGLASLKAALKPASTSYLFFVSNNDGTHSFSKTYKDHLKAVRAYKAKKEEEQ